MRGPTLLRFAPFGPDRLVRSPTKQTWTQRPGRECGLPPRRHASEPRAEGRELTDDRSGRPRTCEFDPESGTLESSSRWRRDGTGSGQPIVFRAFSGPRKVSGHAWGCQASCPARRAAVRGSRSSRAAHRLASLCCPRMPFPGANGVTVPTWGCQLAASCGLVELPPAPPTADNGVRPPCRLQETLGIPKKESPVGPRSPRPANTASACHARGRCKAWAVRLRRKWEVPPTAAAMVFAVPAGRVRGCRPLTPAR